MQQNSRGNVVSSAGYTGSEVVEEEEEELVEKHDLNRRVVRKLDFILLPFLALFFLVNSLDRSNIGNAETAQFTKDAGLQPSDLNTAVALFFAFFVVLQPAGAACGRRFGMRLWVPSVMTIWGVCTILHIWVSKAWQLYTLRIAIGILEAGFYPTSVAYLSLFYTRYEFARRLGIFYGQYAIAGALGGILAYVVFSAYPRDPDIASERWKSWQVLFLIEGLLTIAIALIGFVWLPESAETAWFFSQDERRWSATRIVRDRLANQLTQRDEFQDDSQHHVQNQPRGDASEIQVHDSHATASDEAEHLLASPTQHVRSYKPISHFTTTSGLTTHDIVAAFTDPKVYTLLILNILSAIPAAAFTVFLPLVVRGLGFHAAHANLLTAPPFATGAAVLFVFVWVSDRRRERLVPILAGLGILLTGLTLTVALPRAAAGARYAALCVLLGGSFVASPLTIAWLSGNIEAPGKRAVVLGINGWGNLAGVFSSLLFDERFAPRYLVPFAVTLVLVAAGFAGFLAFRGLLVRENGRRAKVVAGWTAEEVQRERMLGTGPAPLPIVRVAVLRRVERWLGRTGAGASEGEGEGREGEEKLTFTYGL